MRPVTAGALLCVLGPFALFLKPVRQILSAPFRRSTHQPEDSR